MKRFLIFMFAAGIAWASSGIAFAENWPSKPIRIIVPYPPGGTSDILARALSPGITAALGQPVVVENKPGATGNLGADYVAKSPPDGYVFLLADIGSLAISPSVFAELPFDPVKDFAPVAMVAYSPHILAVHPSVPAKNVKELIALAKAKPDSLNFAVSGIGGANHLAGIDFAMRSGIKWTYIPYKGGSQAISDVSRRPGAGALQRNARDLSLREGRQAEGDRDLERQALLGRALKFQPSPNRESRVSRPVRGRASSLPPERRPTSSTSCTRRSRGSSPRPK